MVQKKQEYNQPAFPTMDDIQNVADFKTTDGMTLLDYFAGKALIGILTNPGRYNMTSHQQAYETAAAMMEERKKYL